MRQLIAGRQRGFSLVELMVGLVVGMIVVGAVTSFTVTMLRSSNQNIQSARLTQDLRASMTLITRELRRAGYDEKAVTRLGLGAELSNFTPLEAPPSGPAGCVSYQYNRAVGQFRAIRLNKGALEMATANAVITGCTAGSWNVVSDPDVVTITSFTPKETRETFSDIIQSRVESGNTVVTAGCGVVRNISVDITGSLVADTSISRSIHDEVRVRADPLQFVSQTYTGFGPAVPTVDEECALRDLCLSAYGETEDNDPDCAGASP